MKWKVPELESRLKQQNISWPGLVCVYGEDAGLAKDLARKVAMSLAPDLDDPFAVDRIRCEDVLENPSAIYDSLGTVSFAQSQKLIYLEGVSKDLSTQAVQKLSKSIIDALDALNDSVVLVFAAPGFDPKHALIKNIEKHKLAVGVRCFLDNMQSLRSVVQDFFRKEDKKIAPDALNFLLENLGNDRAVTLGELEKLSIYMGTDNTLTLEHCLESVSAAPSVNVFKLCDAIGMRDRAKADEYLQFLEDEGQDSSAVLALVIRHMRRLLQAKEMVEQGMNLDNAMMSLKPPVFFGKREFSEQVRGYPLKRLRGSLERLYEIQLESRQGTIDPSLIVSRGILALAF